jgi:sterol 3beta-glucosyltransferase
VRASLLCQLNRQNHYQPDTFILKPTQIDTMRLTAVTFGSRGDVEPFATLARSLAGAGHHVRLLTHPEYVRLVSGSAVEFVGARGRSPRELVESDEGREVLRHARNPLAMLRRIADVLAPELRLIYEDTQEAISDADAVLAFPATFPALDVADHLGCPIVHVHHVPAVPTARFPAPAPYIRTRSLSGPGNRASYTVDAWLLWQLIHSAADRARADVLGTPTRRYRLRPALAQRRRRLGALVGISRHVLPPPRDWPSDTVACGYWWPSDDQSGSPVLDEGTSRFLQDGPPPVFLGLGSTPVDDPAAVTRTVAEAARMAGVRLVLQRGWADLGTDLEDSRIHVVGDISYQAIFPQVAGVAHHGGAGTAAFGLRFGRPTLCLPAVADQFFWGHRLAALGAGPPPLPLARLRPGRLAERLAALTGGAYRARASRIQSGLDTEDGPGTAVAAVDRFLARIQARTHGRAGPGP